VSRAADGAAPAINLLLGQESFNFSSDHPGCTALPQRITWKLETQRATAAIGDLQNLTTSWLRHLRAANLSPRTIKNYREAAEQLLAFLTAEHFEIIRTPSATSTQRRS
jgi:isochorismate hydrolase